MPRNQSFLTDAYQASKTRRPLDDSELTAPPAAPTAPSMAGASMMPGLMGGALKAAPMASATTAPAMGGAPSVTPMKIPGMPSLTAAATAPTLDTRQPAGQSPRFAPPVMPTAPPPTAPVPGAGGPTMAPTPTGPVPQAGAPGAISIPGQTGNYPYDSPQRAYERFQQMLAENPEGWKQFGPYMNAGPGMATSAWLQYIMGDPYNRMITDASERQSLNATNTAFDAARGRMRADALQAGAGGSGVAAGMSKGMELARGNAQAANVRDYEKFKVSQGDQRLRDLGLGWMQSSPWAGQGGVRSSGPSQSQQDAERKAEQEKQLMQIAMMLIAA